MFCKEIQLTIDELREPEKLFQNGIFKFEFAKELA